MSKRKLHHIWTKARQIKPWYFLVLAVISLIIGGFALRSNNQEMLRLKEAVIKADENGTDIQRPLRDLQAYVTSHMNTDLSSGKNPVYPPIQLPNTYQRLVQAQNDSFAKANQQIYNDAQKHCEQQNPTAVSGSSRIPCIMQYVESRSTQKMPTVPEDLYKFSFASPGWSPDLAGWSLVVAAVSGLLFIATFAGRWLLRRSVK